MFSEKTSLEWLWCLETIGMTDPVGRESDDEALEMFYKAIKFKDGRYQVAWPWKSDKAYISDNHDVALRRMQVLVRWFQSDECLLQSYDSIIRQQLNQGIIERVDDTMSAVCTKKLYLPHDPVLTPNKATTKIRIVYDVSSKAGSSINSLNECSTLKPTYSFWKRICNTCTEESGLATHMPNPMGLYYTWKESLWNKLSFGVEELTWYEAMKLTSLVLSVS